MKFEWIPINPITLPIDGNKSFSNGLGYFFFKGGTYISNSYDANLFDPNLTQLGVHIYSNGRRNQDNFVPVGVEYFPLVLTTYTNTYYFIGSNKEMILKEIFNVFKFHKIPTGLFFGKGGETIKLISKWLGRRINFDAEFNEK